jgi:hypothetical protein
VQRAAAFGERWNQAAGQEAEAEAEKPNTATLEELAATQVRHTGREPHPPPAARALVPSCVVKQRLPRTSCCVQVNSIAELMYPRGLNA